MARGDLVRLEQLAWGYRLSSGLIGFMALSILVSLPGAAVSSGWAISLLRRPGVRALFDRPAA